jgi:hypothetical protein
MLAAEVTRTAGSTPHVPMCCPASRARPEWSPPAAEALHAASPCPQAGATPPQTRAAACARRSYAARDMHAAAGRAGSRSDPPRLHPLLLLVTGVREHLLLSCL